MVDETGDVNTSYAPVDYQQSAGTDLFTEQDQQNYYADTSNQNQQHYYADTSQQQQPGHNDAYAPVQQDNAWQQNSASSNSNQGPQWQVEMTWEQQQEEEHHHHHHHHHHKKDMDDKKEKQGGGPTLPPQYAPPPPPGYSNPPPGQGAQPGTEFRSTHNQWQQQNPPPPAPPVYNTQQPNYNYHAAYNPGPGYPPQGGYPQAPGQQPQYPQQYRPPVAAPPPHPQYIAPQVPPPGSPYGPGPRHHGMLRPELGKPPMPWTSDIFHFLNDCYGCPLVVLAPCVAFGQIAEIMDTGYNSCLTAGLIYSFALLLGFPCLYSYTYRTKMRYHFNLREDPLSDFCVHLWCEPCALSQEYRELKYRGIDPNLGYAMQQTSITQAMVAPVAPRMQHGYRRSG